MKRNVKVELIRIIACFAVIWYHIRQLPWKTTGELSETAVFFECICTICVMTFFLISGFFIYDKNGNIFYDWWQIIKKFIKAVFIPFLIVVIICIIFHEFFISRESFIWCIENFSINTIITTIADSFIHFSATYLPGTAAHLWYIYSYILIILAYPITRFILRKFDRKIVYIILIILTICMVINDYFLFFGDPTYNAIFKIIHKPIYYSAFGYILYHDLFIKHIDNRLSGTNGKVVNVIIINKPLFIASIVLYLITFVALFKTQVGYDLGHNGEYVYTSWLSTFSLVLTSSFVTAIYDINFERYLNDKIRDIIYFVSSKTLGVYLIHYIIITKFLSIGFQESLTKYRPTIIQHFLYYIFYSLFIFILSFAIVLLVDFIVNGVKKMLKGKVSVK